ncbi:hypothetical protein [Tumebacillus flagellatus]|uniref:Carboxymuconolactone decarboxylase-like domain-containing protein n=1 Tax=Tumebacillus flagellatus TaxID=1157490 RepID=A0A074LTH0_9BACL|nr:hypothetical protein [Tumebacillus flagellatus]KEO83860.1 hypothetical protein EL26_08055 [Tumebacillus flagellatus]
MSIIKPVTNEQVEQDLQAAFARSEANSGSSNMLRTYAHNQELAKAFSAYYSALWNKGTVNPVLKEMLRYRAATVGECVY